MAMTAFRAQPLSCRQYASIAALLILAFAFSCRGLTLAHASPVGHDASHGAMPLPAGSGDCCALDHAAGSALAHAQFASALPTAYVLLLILALVIFFPFVPLRAYALFPYRGRPDRRYGGTRLFSPYVYLFSQGILHPKTF
ncbi:MAG: hypothetical protein HYS45_00930 [Parcubacteria group bacterium]|nr:hypothetical protein [Parcubacteria group bacterium]